jgi:peptidoglycan hydrolase-like protein with peptidoglycan-binding domain
MSVVATRLVFLAFLGLTGFITYNALYLQEQRNASLLSSRKAPGVPLPTGPIHVNAPPAVKPGASLDLPALPSKAAPPQLVTAIQRELTLRGYARGPADGKLSDDTRKAIAAFEKEHGLAVTGAPSDDLLRRILLGEAVAPAGSTGSVVPSVPPAKSASPAKATSSASDDATVKQVQQILADLGYAPGPVDGALGDETERALSAFQRDRKIAQTGRITPELLREIKRVTGRDLAATQRP